MLITPRAQFVERIITSTEGLKFKVVFAVVEEAGKIKARAISATLIEEIEAIETTQTLYLPGPAATTSFVEPVSEKPSTKTIPSPYASLLYFTCSIPRGPNSRSNT